MGHTGIRPHVCKTFMYVCLSVFNMCVLYFSFFFVFTIRAVIFRVRDKVDINLNGLLASNTHSWSNGYSEYIAPRETEVGSLSGVHDAPVLDLQLSQ